MKKHIPKRPKMTETLLQNIKEIMIDSCDELNRLSDDIEQRFNNENSINKRKVVLLNMALNNMNDEIIQLQRTRNFVIEALGNQPPRI